MIALQRRVYQLTGKYIGLSRMQRHLLKLRKRLRFSFWQQMGSQAVQELAQRQHQAYQRFFAYKRGESQRRVGRPSFKKVKQYKSFTLKQAGWKLLRGNQVRIQGYVYKFSLSRPVEGEVKTVTIKRDNLGHLWVCFSVIQEHPEPVVTSTGKWQPKVACGFDFGLKRFLTDSEANTYLSPQFFKAESKEIARLNRSLAHKQKGSNNWHKARHQLAKTHARVAHKRSHYHWQLAHALAARYDYLFFETLHIQAMQRRWGRKVSDLGFAAFLAIQKQVCQKRGKTFVQIDKWLPTTKPCCRCGVIHELSLADRLFHCSHCGLVIDRDLNAAINICAEGASSAGLGDVRQKLMAAITVRPQESLAL